MCVASASSAWPSSSEMSDRTRSSSEMESSEGGMDESEDEEEKERGNMKIDYRWEIKEEGNTHQERNREDKICTHGHKVKEQTM